MKTDSTSSRQATDNMKVEITNGIISLTNEGHNLLTMKDENPDAQVIHLLKWNGERVFTNEDKFLNPEWNRDKRKARYLTADEASEAVLSRFETVTEIAERKLNALLMRLENNNAQVSKALMQSTDLA